MPGKRLPVQSMATRRLLTVRFILIAASLAAGLSSVSADEIRDTREGETVTLKCRFSEQSAASDFSYYWARSTGNKFDNVAIKGVQLNTNYRIDFRPEQGIYDLMIMNTSYSRDNGRFECRVKASGTGADVHQEYYNLTVLTPPQPPFVEPVELRATEDERFELTCSSLGGSPDPTITWYRVGSEKPLKSSVAKGGSKDLRTSGSLSIVPRREDDGAKFRCVVWNRAMAEKDKLETTVTLSVNYYPRVKVGPENPLRVERDNTAVLECAVDSKPKVPNVRWTRNGRLISSSPTHPIQRVSLQDAGNYACSADNGLGKVGEQVITLDVLFAPIVVIESKTWEAEERSTVTIRCNVTSNPAPVTVEWFKEGSPDFRYAGDILQLRDVKAEHAGRYVCRAVNMMKPYNGKIVERVGNSTVALLVRHRPGQAYINPSKPVVHVGNGVTLTCSANPPGWPVPQFRWFKDAVGEVSTSKTILAQGPQYVIPRAHLGSEGSYHCHAVNELGHGPMATINLEVHQPPQFIGKMQQHMTKRVGDTDFSATCHAKGKPRPMVRWLKDGRDITTDANMYRIGTNNNDGLSGMVTVQSTLLFQGKARPHKSQLLPSDRGTYTCLFENEVSTANASMNLRIEHGPIVLHQYNKVAYEINENAAVVCRVQAYPKPEFQWQLGTNTAALSMSSDGHYEINTTTDNNDIYTSVLRINRVRHEDYGDYTCRVGNSIETIRAPIRLQPKGPPEKPSNLAVADVGSNYVSLVWDPGFDGGITSTKFFVSFRKVAIPHHDQVREDCGRVQQVSSEWMEYDCQRDVPCSVTPLDQYQSYVFKVKATNGKGNSEPSNEVATTTKISKIPVPLHVGFDPDTKQLGVSVGATCLALNAVVETIGFHESPIATWQIVRSIPLAVSGNGPTYEEQVLEDMYPARRASSGRSMVNDDDFPMALEEEIPPKVRVKLCLKSSHEYCGDYMDAEIGPALIHDSPFIATPTLIAIVVSCVVFALFVGLLLMFCRCKRNQTKKSNQAKDYEMDSVRPSLVAQQSQAPPPYYPTTTAGLDNKALEHSMDLALALEDQKTSVYATHNGYGYHTGTSIQVAGHSLPATEWVTMGYTENSYTNSNNGGSVNSQDSIWQLKGAPGPATMAIGMQPLSMAGMHGGGGGGGGAAYATTTTTTTAAGAAGTAGLAYGYDPIASHSSVYGTGGVVGAVALVDEYSQYPHQAQTPSQLGGEDDYLHHHLHHAAAMRQSQNPSRQQEYCGDSYASVHKAKKRLEQPSHFDASYHDVSGLPDPYLDAQQQQQQLHHLDQEDSKSLLHLNHHPQQQDHGSLHLLAQQQQQQQPPQPIYEENLESGYSTPNSRNRRVIREIIV
ncbi:hemicentin-2-like [Anopheles cruzii]|uniref:hemicentin-2-like n=1 Tax=Anopheles cruzii TaxID=68878 RepID=UPI0022EC9816|nr:hemicentin-2-like [Anopheles cruzii]